MEEIGGIGLDTIPKILRHNAKKWGKHVCIRKKDLGIWHEYTWEDLYREACFFANGLLTLEFEKGDKMSIIGDNDPQWCCGQLGAQIAGGAVTGIFSDVIPEEAKYIIGHSDSKVVLANDQEQVDKILKVKDELPLLKKVIYWDNKGLRNYKDPLLLYYDELISIGKKEESKFPGRIEKLIDEGTSKDTCLLLYTSGVTGLPKGVILSHRCLIASLKSFHQVFDIQQGEDLFSAFPSAWMGEQLFGIGAFIATGAILNYPEEPETVQDDYREISPTMAIFGPRQWEKFCSDVQVKMRDADILKRSMFNLFLPICNKATRYSLSKKTVPFHLKALDFIGRKIVFKPLLDKLGMRKTRIFITGSAALSPDTFEFLHTLGLKLRQAYAGTESGFAFAHYSDDIQSESVGRPAPGIQFKIAGTQELLIKGDTLFDGYYKNTQETEKALKDGWFHTGDAAIVKDDGHLVYIDRVTELGQLSTGASYSPQYIESRLRFSPYLIDALVVGRREHPFISAILNIDFGMVGKWAEDNKINYTTFVDLSQRPEVAELVLTDILRINKILPKETKIKKYVLLHKEFDADEGELTRTRKIKRNVMEKTYTDLIEAIYTGKDSITINAPVKYRDGRTGVIKTELKMRTVEGS